MQAMAVYFLPYHNFGKHKCSLLGRPYSLEDLEKPDKNESERIKLMFEKYGLSVKIGG